MKDTVYLVTFDSSGEEPELVMDDSDENELMIPITCTDRELVTFLRKHSADEEDTDGTWGKDWEGQPNTWGWRCDIVHRKGSTATVEWRSDRNHLAVTTVIWL